MIHTLLHRCFLLVRAAGLEDLFLILQGEVRVRAYPAISVSVSGMKRVYSSIISQLARQHNCLLAYLPCLTSAWPWTKAVPVPALCPGSGCPVGGGTSGSSRQLPRKNCVCRLYPRTQVMLFVFVSQSLHMGSSCSILQLWSLLNATRTCMVKWGQGSLYRALVQVVWNTERGHAGGVEVTP